VPETQKKIHVSPDDVERLMREAVAERGADYVYREHFAECLYVYPRITSNLDEDDESEGVEENDAKAACIVGEVLHRAGVPLRELDIPDAMVSTLAGANLSPVCGGSASSDNVAMLVERALAHLFPDPDGPTLPRVDLDPVAFRMLQAAQYVQDSNNEFTWGQALEAALEVRQRCAETS
jgi:hypothetical protein